MAWLGVSRLEHSSGTHAGSAASARLVTATPEKLLVEAALGYRRPARQFAAGDDGLLMRRPSVIRYPTADISVIQPSTLLLRHRPGSVKKTFIPMEINFGH
jgi:hypothetical protein